VILCNVVLKGHISVRIVLYIFFSSKELSINFRANYSIKHTDFGAVPYVGLLTFPHSHILWVYFSRDAKVMSVTKITQSNRIPSPLDTDHKSDPSTNLTLASLAWHICSLWGFRCNILRNPVRIAFCGTRYVDFLGLRTKLILSCSTVLPLTCHFSCSASQSIQSHVVHTLGMCREIFYENLCQNFVEIESLRLCFFRSETHSDLFLQHRKS
jgi:hypothetical protein